MWRSREGPLEVVLREVVEELLPDAEGPSSAEVDLGFSPGFELGREADQGVAQVLGVARSGDRGHGRDLGDARRRDQDRGSSRLCPTRRRGASRSRRRKSAAATRSSRLDESRLGEVPFALADAGEVEPEHRNPPARPGRG